MNVTLCVTPATATEGGNPLLQTNRTTNKLTDTGVRQARPRAAEYNLGDGRGLFLRVKPTGTKQWVFNYSHPFTKRRSNIGLGIYPGVSLATAREKAQGLRDTLSKGIDPIAE
ncbi:MAG: Arm DNA-binding domain-containing protein, partial [Pseudomonadales bacterium]|nr:Arm DNA-binding domain-containing protein [Pseudomonadales bacterium]